MSSTETLISILTTDTTCMSSGLDSSPCLVEGISPEVPAEMTRSFGDLLSFEAPVSEFSSPESTILAELDLLDSSASCSVECIFPEVQAEIKTSYPDLMSFEDFVEIPPEPPLVEVECARVGWEIHGLSTRSDIMAKTSPVKTAEETKAEEVQKSSPVEADTPSSPTKSSVDIPKTSNASVGTSDDIPEWRRMSPTHFKAIHAQKRSSNYNPNSPKRRYRRYSPPRTAASSSPSTTPPKGKNVKCSTRAAVPIDPLEDSILYAPQPPSPYHPDGTLKIIPPLESMHAPWNNPPNEKSNSSKRRDRKSSPHRKHLPTPPTSSPTTTPQVKNVKRSTSVDEPTTTSPTQSVAAPERPSDQVYGGSANLRGDLEKLERLNQPSRGVSESRWAPR